MKGTRRVAVTGMGIVSSIGANCGQVSQSLRAARSGIVYAEDYAEKGFRSRVHGLPPVRPEAVLDRKARRFLGDGAAWNMIAMEEAIAQSGLEEGEIKSERTGIVMGSGGPSTRTLIESADITRSKGARRVSPFAVPKAMSSTNSATLAVHFGMKGVNYSITSACATSAHCIGHGGDLIRWGRQDIVFAGGGEELDWSLSVLFDGMNAMSSRFNEEPHKASRPFDKDRDGFVIAGGGGVLILEEMERAKGRGARILAELSGFGATADGSGEMVQPSPDGAARCMRQALEGLERPVDYINAHATSTPVGDRSEIEAIRDVFGDEPPPISATKALTGHSLGAAGVQEAVYSLLMMEGGFLCESANIETLDPDFEGMPILRERRDDVRVDCVLSNSFGFGGTNGSLVFTRV